jgi:SAM-dependent methyltransferase
VVGTDLSPDALAYVRANRPSTLPVRADVQALPFRDGCFEQIVALTILYTVADDTRALHELARVLRPGGALVVVEPAFAALRRAHDDVVHGRRRYRRSELSAMLRDAGLVPLRLTYAYSFLAPPAATLGLVERARGQGRGRAASSSDVERRALDRVFAPMAAVERRFLARHNVAFGTSVLALATRDQARGGSDS